MEDQVQRSPAELQAALLAVCDRHGWPASFIQSKPQSREQLVRLCVKELAACRAAGRGELAVALADAAVAAGLEHPRLAVHRARVLSEQQGGALVRQQEGSASALAVKTPARKRRFHFWHWLPGLGGKQKAKRQRADTAFSPEQRSALLAVCAAADWNSAHLAGDAASDDPGRALFQEVRRCAEAGEHQLVVKLVRKAAGLGIKHPRLRRARLQSEALLQATLQTQLQNAVSLREQGQPLASLSLLDSALERGGERDAIQHNRALALVALGRRNEALAIWDGLRESPTPTLVSAAKEMLVIHQQQFLMSLHEQLQRIAREHNWPLRHLLDPSGIDINAYTTSFLHEVIDLRNQDRSELSLTLIDEAQAAGLQNPWLHDNRARALVHLNQIAPAVAIWEQLLSAEDSAIRQTAQEMLDLYGPPVRRIHVLKQAQDMMKAHDLDAAISLLTEAVIEDPECSDFQTELQALLSQRQGDAPPSGGHIEQDELDQHRRRLLAFEEVLNTLEARLQTNQENLQSGTP